MPLQSENFIALHSAINETREGYKLDLASEILRSGGTIRLRALGTSMLPSIWPGDVLSVEHRQGEEVVPGDVVLVERDGRFLVHRLIEKDESHWITRGDSLLREDEPVDEEQVLGRVSVIRRRTRDIVPNRRLSWFDRILAWTFRRWDSPRNTALRVHSLYQRGARLKTALQLD